MHASLFPKKKNKCLKKYAMHSSWQAMGDWEFPPFIG